MRQSKNIGIMETKTVEEKVKTIILEEIKNLASITWSSPTDDNICELFNTVEYLKKVLRNTNVRVRKSSDVGGNNLIAQITQTEYPKITDDGVVFSDYR